MPDSEWVPIVLALFAAALFGAQGVLARRSLRYVDAQTGAMLTIVTATAVLWLLSPLHVKAAYWRSAAMWVFVVNGFVHPTLSLWLSFEATRRMGATVAATVAATTPLFATAGAVLALGERLTPTILLGTLGTVAGIIVFSWSRAGATPWRLSALIFPTGAAAARAFNQVWISFGLSMLPVPLFAATISFTMGCALSVFAYRVRHGALPLRLPRRGVLWGVLSGLSVVMAVGAMYTALAIGQVVVVSPLINTYPLFTLMWAALFRQESLSRRIVLAVVLVVAGVALIGLR